MEAPLGTGTGTTTGMWDFADDAAALREEPTLEAAALSEEPAAEAFWLAAAPALEAWLLTAEAA